MIINLVRRLFASGPYYVRVNRERLSARDVATGEEVECRTHISINDSKIVVSVGDPISPEATNTLQPFDHPRILIEDYTAAEKIFMYVVRKLSGYKYFMPSPVMVVHPDLELEGGITQIELRALREIAEASGARTVYFHSGRQLTDQEVRAIAVGEMQSLEKISVNF